MKVMGYCLAFIGIFLALSAQEKARINKLETGVKSLQAQVGLLGKRISALEKAQSAQRTGVQKGPVSGIPTRPSQPSRTFKEYTEPGSKVQPKEVTVYITKTGKKYHSSGCRYLSRSKIPVSLKGAKAQGYGACSVCNPPR